MDKKRVLYLSGSKKDLNALATMLAKPEINVACITTEAKYFDVNLETIEDHLGLPCDGMVVDFDLKRGDGLDGVKFLKMCHKSKNKAISEMPKVLIVDDETLDLTERQMEEVRHYQFGLLYKPRFDGHHIAKLLLL